MRWKSEVRRCLRIVVVVGVWLFLFTNLGSAQQDAGIIGQVKDESGGVLPGVTVTATSPALQAPEVTAFTNEQGEYRLTPLPIGTYTVLYTLTGFQTVRQEAVRLEIGVVPRLDVVLKVSAVEESITVSGASPVVDVTSTATSTQFTRETLELTPSARNGIISLGAQAPAVRGRVDIGGGTVGDPPIFRTFGQAAGEWITVEGLNTNDPKTTVLGGNYFDYAAMEEARIQAISNSPEVAAPGVAITVQIKSGGNAFHGSGNYSYMDQRFQSNNVDAALRAQGITSGNTLDLRTDQGGDLGGRIIRNKLWFYVAGRYRPQRLLQLNAFKPDGSQADTYRAEIIQNDKVSYQMNPANRFVFWSQWAQKYQYGVANEFQAWESRLDRKPPVRSVTWKTEWQGVRRNLVMSLLVGQWGWTGGINGSVKHTDAAEAAGVPRGIEVTQLSDESHGGNRPSTFDQVTLRQAGRSTFSGNWNENGKWSAKGTLNWYRPNFFLGNHEFKAGFNHEPNFSLVAEGLRGEAGQYRLIFNSGTPLQIDLYNYPVVPQANITYTSGYANDTWTIARRLTLDLGARYARDNPTVPAQCRLAGAWPFAPAACVDKVQFKIWNSIAPRLYFSYDVSGDAKTVVKGGWGRFDYQRVVPDFLFMHPFQAVTASYRWRDPNGNRNYDLGEVDLNQNGPDFISSDQPVSGVSNPNEKRPGTDQFSLTLERQLGRDFGVRISGVYIRTFNEARYLNTLRPYDVYSIPITNRDPGPDGDVGTSDDPGTFLTYHEYPEELAGRQNERFIITDDPKAAETHKTIEFGVVKRISSRWQLLASYSATTSDTLLLRNPFGYSVGSSIPNFDPNTEINTGKNGLWEWVGKVSGTYLLPAGVSVSANFNYESGLPQARQVLVRGGRTIPNIVLNAEPLGSIHLPHTNVLDVRVDKTFTLPRGRVGVRANLYNALNANTVNARTLRSGPSYLRPTSIVSPRIAEFGISYSF